MKTKQSMTLRTLAMVAALWLACAASALAQTNIYNGTRDGGEQPSTGENNGGNTGTGSQVEPGGGGGTGTDAPVGGGGGAVINKTEQRFPISDITGLSSACEKTIGNEGIVYYLTEIIQSTSTLVISKCLKLDLNGKSIIFHDENGFACAENAQLTIIDSQNNFNKGYISCSHDRPTAAISLNRGSWLIADGVTIICDNGKAIFNDGGTAEITGSIVRGHVGINNKGTTTVTGGSISGTHTAIDNLGGKLYVNLGDNPAKCTISGRNFGIFNGVGCEVTLGKDVSIGDFTFSGIYHNGSNFFLNALPTFTSGSTAGVSDICLCNDKFITFYKQIKSFPSNKIRVRLVDDELNDLTSEHFPYFFTFNYSDYFLAYDGTTLDPAEVFTYYDSSAGLAVALDAATSTEAQLVVGSTTPADGTDVTNDLSPTASGDFNVDWEFEMPDYDVLVYFVYDNLFDPVTFAFAEGQEWMTWCGGHHRHADHGLRRQPARRAARLHAAAAAQERLRRRSRRAIRRAHRSRRCL